MKVKKVDYRDIQSFILLIAAISASFSVLTGLMLIRGGDYAGDLVSNHKWVAIALSVICWGLFILSKRIITAPYYVGLVSSAVLLGITGHLGGSITHGEGFLTKSSNIEVRPSVEEAVLYTDIIRPIFDSKCYSCHNPTKIKGDLDMTTEEGLLKGGENGVILSKGDADEASLLSRVHLPLSDEDHMPPENKAQLSEDEITLIEWWIANDANFEALVLEVMDYDEHKETVAKFLAPPETDIFAYVPKPDSISILSLKQNGLKLYPVNAGSSAVYVNFLDNKDLKGRDFSSLRKLKNNVAHLNLASSSITDEMITKVNRFKHLEKLELQNTEVTSKGINKLKDFQFLQTLNLFNTKVDSSAIDKILSFPQLRNVFLWKTKLSNEQVAAMRLERPRLNIVHAIDIEMFDNAALKPPVIAADQDVFNDSLEIALELGFNGVEIFYILNDGDTLKYDSPFKIMKTTQVKTLAKKEGWLSSPINERTFVKSGKKIEEIKLNNQPHKRYADFATKVLINNKLGSPRFNDGEWVGYEGAHSRTTLRLDKTAEVQEVNVGALELTGSYIFYPKGIRIQVSEDGKKFTEVASKDYVMVDQPSSAGRRLFNLSFEKKKARWIRIDVFSHLKNPDWHEAPGAKNWIFIDEILVN
jgi:hypothetical protein